MRPNQWSLTAAVLLLAACSGNGDTAAGREADAVRNTDRVVVLKDRSPAEANCMLMGGTMALSRQLNGNNVGTCQLANGKRCDETALLNGACPAG